MVDFVNSSELLESLPFWVFFVKFLAVVGEEEKCKYCEENTPESSPKTHMIYQSGEADSIVDNIG